MLTQEDLQMLRVVIKEEIEPINARLDRIEESLNEVREATNYIAEWVESVENKVDRIAR